MGKKRNENSHRSKERIFFQNHFPAPLYCILLEKRAFNQAKVFNSFMLLQCLFFINLKILSGMKMVVFWVVAQCSLVEVHQRSCSACCLHHQCNHSDDKMSENFYQSAWHYSSKDSHFPTCCHENLTFYFFGHVLRMCSHEVSISS
jgi:hypothetical protein